MGERLALRSQRKTHAAAALLVCFLNALPSFAQDLTSERKDEPTTSSTSDANPKTDKSAKSYSVFQTVPTVIDERGAPTGRGQRIQKTSPTLPEGAPNESSKPSGGEKKDMASSQENAGQKTDSKTQDDSLKPSQGPRDMHVFNVNPAVVDPASATSGREARRRAHQKRREEQPEKK